MKDASQESFFLNQNSTKEGTGDKFYLHQGLIDFIFMDG